MAWDEFRWKWLRKHEPLPDSVRWDQLRKATTQKGGASKFIRSIDKPDFQEFAEQNMRRIRQTATERFYYVLFDFEIGVSGGSGTNIARLRWHSCNDIHGYPIPRSELIEELRLHNQPEYERYLAEV
jgi:hypothetical protein